MSGNSSAPKLNPVPVRFEDASDRAAELTAAVD
jgi:hypothetical protein